MAIKYTPTPLPTPQRLNFEISKFYGLNKTVNAMPGEFVECKNMSSDKFPFASPASKKSLVAEGIENPQKIFFCGDKLSYIASGNLYVKSGDEFKQVGNVGNVTSIVDFNDEKVLFYPDSLVFDVNNEEITDVSTKMNLVKGYIDASNNYSLTSDDGGYLMWKFRDENLSAATMVVLNDQDGIDFCPGIAKDEAGEEVTDEDGNKVYNTITINISNYSPGCVLNAAGNKNNISTRIKLFVQAFKDEAGTIPFNKYFIYGNDNDRTYTYYWKMFEFGEPLLFDGVAPAMMRIMVGYYKPNTYSTHKYDYVYEELGRYNDEVIKIRDDDFSNSNFKLTMNKTTYPGPNSIPVIKYACMDNNRVVGVEGNNFYASSLGDYSKWTDFVDAEGNPKATGSYAEELNSFGNFTGIFKYQNYIVLTKADITYVCRGNKPPYRISEICKIGCISADTITEIDGYLYWLGQDGIYRFGGGVPVLISEKLDTKFISGSAVTYNHKYYICLNDGTKWQLYCYDTRYDMWHIEDANEYISLACKADELYGLTADGNIYKFFDGKDYLRWEFTTTDFDFNTEYTKNIAKIYCRLKLYGQAWVDVYIKSNNQDWYKFANFKANDINVFQAKCKIKKCDYFRLKFVGSGDCEIMDIYADCTLGTQKHRAGMALTKFRKN